MHIISVILCNLTMFIVSQCKLVILCTVYYTLLDSCIHFTKTHRRGSSSECLHHRYTCRTLLYSYLHSRKVCRCIYCLLAIEISCSGIIPCKNPETGRICWFIYIFHIICILHYRLIAFNRIKKIWHTEHFIYICKCFKISCTCNCEINSSCLCKLYCFLYWT